MTVQGLKGQTEDIDLALGVVSEFDHVNQTLTSQGFTVVGEPTESFEGVGKTVELHHDEQGFQIGLFERLRLPDRGKPKWRGGSDRLDIAYDSVEDAYRVHQSVTVDEAEKSESNGSEAAALDLGANVLVAYTTTTSEQYLYIGQTPYEQFRDTTNRIADAQAKLPDGQHMSQRIKRLYRKRSRRRDHAVNALLRDLVERLDAAGVTTLYHGDLTGVLGEYWSVEANFKARSFWAHQQCIDRLESVCEEYGIDVEAISEAWTSQTCPECGERD
ncbi:transposase [Haladaptatus sp. NG-SE-30]